ncbi:MAG TPA: hypothetical protein DCY79_06020 [Planctomycetaceae bacterium]|nr:hypothetical protein [Planctomycetaceae bacterium]
MPATAAQNVDAFLALVEKSEVLSKKQLEKVKTLAADTTDPKLLAKSLIRDRVLTAWQAYQFLGGVFQLRVGKYTLREQIGKGDLGRVYLASHTQLDREVALKILAQKHLASKASVDRFLNEARQAAQLDHRNLIHIFDVDKQGDRYFVVMEPIVGKDLGTIVDQTGPLPLLEIADYIRQAACGLSHAHSKNLLHQDLTPDKLYVDEHGLLKISGFGMGGVASARLSPEAEQSEKSADYISPEQALQKEKLTKATDLYSLGCVMYYLLTGQPPFPEGTDAERRKKHVTEKATPIEELRPDAPKGLINICRKLMAKKVENRFGSADAVDSALTKWLDQNRPAEVVEEAMNDTIITDPLADPLGEPLADPLGEPLSASPAVSEGASEFAVDISGAGRSKSKSKAKSTSKVSKSKRSSKDEETTGGKKRLLWWILGGVGVAATLLVTAVALVVVFVVLPWMRSAQDMVEAVGEDTQVAAVVEDGGSEGTEDSTDDGEPDEGTTDDGTTEGDDEPGDDSSTEEPKEVVEETEPIDGEDDPNEEPADPQDPNGNDSDTTGTDDGDPPADPEPPTTEPPTTEPPTVKPPKNPPKPPFAALVDVVPLPAVAETAAFEIGPVYIPEGGLCFLRARGGEQAYKEPFNFVIRNADAGQAERDWEVHLVNVNENARVGTIIAKLSLQEDKLTFEWTPEAASTVGASSFVNCLLSLSSDDASRVIRMREAVEVEPLELALTTPRTTEKWDVPSAPEGAELQVEILGVAGFPKYHLDPPQAFAANKGETLLIFDEAPLQLDIQSDFRRQLMLEVNVAVKFPGERKTLKFNKSRLESLEGVAKNQILTYENGIKQLQQQNQLLQNDRRNPRVQENLRNINLANLELEKLKKNLGMLNQVVALADTAGKLHFRMFYRIGSTEVEILRTAGAPQKPAAPK